jgi:ABC-type sulfate/molybdate transport systems ATPase subunit
MIAISQLRVQRQGRCLCAVPELTIAAGERVAILGSNGSGKTTLLRVLAGLTQAYCGHCAVAVDQRARTYLHQQPYLFRGSVLANVRYGQRAGAAHRAEYWLEQLALGHLAARPTAELSGGERRRVALARALACAPKLLLLDEPLADLDEQARERVCQTLQQLPQTTVVIASPVALPSGLVGRSVTMEPAASLSPA